MNEKITPTFEQWLDLMRLVMGLLRWSHNVGFIGKGDKYESLEKLFELLAKFYREEKE